MLLSIGIFVLMTRPVKGSSGTRGEPAKVSYTRK